MGVGILYSRETCNDNYRTVVNSPRRSHRKSTGSRLPGLSRFLDCGMCRSRSMYARGPSRRGPGPVPVERRAGPSFGTKSVEHHLAQTPPRDRLKHTNKNVPIKNNLAKNPHDRFARSPVAAKQQDYPYDSHSTVSSNSSNGSPGSSQRLSQSGYDFVDEISGSSEESATANVSRTFLASVGKTFIITERDRNTYLTDDFDCFLHCRKK